MTKVTSDLLQRAETLIAVMRDALPGSGSELARTEYGLLDELENARQELDADNRELEELRCKIRTKNRSTEAKRIRFSKQLTATKHLIKASPHYRPLK